jgi:hypothetical protein
MSLFSEQKEKVISFSERTTIEQYGRRHDHGIRKKIDPCSADRAKKNNSDVGSL